MTEQWLMRPVIMQRIDQKHSTLQTSYFHTRSMKQYKFLAVAILFSLAACNSHNHEGSATTANMQSPEDSLYKAVMKLHDEAMPKMGKLIGYQKTAQQQIDSLKALGNDSLQPIISRIENLKLKLAGAEQGMNDWMVQFEPDPKMPTTEERAAYFAEQQAKAQKMRNEIFAALDSAATMLK